MSQTRATAEGTRGFAQRAGAADGHFREGMGLSLSSIGLGTYLGDDGAAVDAGYEACIAAGLGAGINVFDSAINYRGQKSERAIGRALAKAFASGAAQRDEVFVSTKGGYFPHDADDPRPMRRYVQESFLASGLAPSAEIAHGYEGTEIKTKDGLTIQGILIKQGDPLMMRSMGGLTQIIPADRVASRRRMPGSLMMSAAQLGLTAQDVADVIAFLRGS